MLYQTKPIYIQMTTFISIFRKMLKGKFLNKYTVWLALDKLTQQKSFKNKMKTSQETLFKKAFAI